MAISFHDRLLEAEDRLELTEDGWAEVVVHPAAANMDHRLSGALMRLGVPDECVFKALRLASWEGAAGKEVAYRPDAVVVLPANPVPCRGHEDYDGVPDLVVEILGGVDLHEKRRNYARRGIPHYWIVDPDTGLVTWLALLNGTYVEQWTRPLSDVVLPWTSDVA
jgi:Uma2 family endonuclease